MFSTPTVPYSHEDRQVQRRAPHEEVRLQPQPAPTSALRPVLTPGPHDNPSLRTSHLALSATVRLLDLVAVGEDLGAVDAPVGATPAERDPP
jgi:hypothetical protein